MFSKIISLSNSDLDMYHCGIEECIPGHYYGPAIRDHYLIHYIRSGKGIFQVNEQTYPLRKGQGFLICPDIVTFYQADFVEPWHYSWVGFQGARVPEYLRMANLSQENPIFSYHEDSFFENSLAQMVEANKSTLNREPKLKGLLYLFLAKLIEIAPHENLSSSELPKKDQYIQSALEYIHMNYSHKISVTQMAQFIGLDRSYFCCLFKERLAVSPQEFIIQFRINKACELMKNLSLSIGDISRSVGYEDQLQFSKIFKKMKGTSPRKYRSQNTLVIES
jgi:AraC-like DNA-binding protein